jgi:hypothetical protein
MRYSRDVIPLFMENAEDSKMTHSETCISLFSMNITISAFAVKNHEAWKHWFLSLVIEKTYLRL